MFKLRICLLLFVLASLMACREEVSAPRLSSARSEIDLTFADSQTNQWTNFRNPNFVYDLAIGDTGIVWTIGANGILRYDTESEEAKYFTIQDGLPSNSSYKLTLAADGTVWILNQGQLIAFDGNNWKTVQPANAADDVQFFDMTIAPNGDIWLLESWETVWRFDGQNWKEMHTGTGNTSIRAAADGRIWVAGKQLLSYDGSSWVEHPYPPNTVGEEFLSIYGFIVDMQGAIWLTVGSTDRSPILYKYDGNTWQDFEIADESILGIYLGEMWADPIAGIWYLSDRRSPGFEVHLTRIVNEEKLNTQSLRFPALLAKSIWGFEALPDGSFWYGSRGHTKWGNTPPGIYHYSGSLWEHLILPASIPDNSIHSCARTNDGRLWFGTDYGLAEFDGQSWEVLTGGAGLPDTISLLVPDNDNMLWISDSYGLTHFGLEIRQFRGELFSLPAITSMATQTGRTLWLGGHDGTVWHFNGHEFINFPIPFQEGYFSLEGLTVAPDNRVWVGYSNGNIFELGDDGWQNIASDDFSSVSVMNFAEGELWTVITDEESNIPSLYSYDGSSWHSHEVAVFNKDENVTAILNAVDGTVWLGTDHGLIEYTPTSESAKRLTTEDGLVDNVVTALCEEPKGSIWIGTRAGLSRYEP